jgi:hypothetical protein
MTDAEYLAWLLADNPRVILADLGYYSGGSVLTERVGTHAYTGVINSQTVSYQPIIAGVPDLVQAMDAPLAVGTLELHNEGGTLDSWLGRAFDGRAITLRIGGPGWAGADFRTLATGIIDHVQATHDRLQVVFRDARERLNGPLTTDTLPGGARIPILIAGENITPVLSDSVTRTYRVTKGPMVNVSAVRANGTPVSFTQNTAAGTLTLSTSATGLITCDAYGESSALESSTGVMALTKAVITLGKLGGLTDSDFDATSFAALKDKLTLGGTAPDDHTFGWFPERVNALDAIESILSPRRCHWGCTRDGKIRVWRLDLPTGTPALTLGLHNIVERSLVPGEWEPAVYHWDIKAVPNYSVQDPSSLDAGLGMGDIELWGRDYLDLVPINFMAASVRTTYAGAVSRGPEVWPMSGPTLEGEITRRRAIHDVPRRRYRLRVFAPSLPIYVGDEVRITYPRFGFASGANAIVTAMKESFAQGITELEVWK